MKKTMTTTTSATTKKESLKAKIAAAKKARDAKKVKAFEKFETVITKCRNVPIAVFLILSTITNYLMGQNIAKVNELYSDITKYEKMEFVYTLLKLIALWMIIRIINQTIGKVTKHWLLNHNYMKWITKLTNSKLSSISSVSTGAANNAINTIAACDKGMVDSVMSIIPNIIPFFMLCKKEWEVAGILPVLVNCTCIFLYVWYSFKAADYMSYKRQAAARAEISTVTVDCIKNSQTVKYFNKESWSINRQEKQQIATFARMLAIPAQTVNTLFYGIMWIPTAFSAFMCWEDTSTVLYVIMMSYVIDNIGGYIGMVMDNYSEKKNALKTLGNLEKDDKIRVNIGNELVIKNVKFSYDAENKDAVNFCINELQIKRGHRYCVTGKSGFGKSTLAKLLTNTYAPIEGTIPAVDSVYMFAESEMFNMSIYDNITMNEEADLEEIMDMLNNLEVSVDLDIVKDSVGENGNKLSTGQKQRINLARTLFYARRHPGALIVMDEVTAALDIKTSLTCLEYLSEEFKRLGVTLIYISNKTDYLETDLITDNIYVNRTGNVVTYDSEDKN